MHAICGAHSLLNGILGSKLAPTPRLTPRDLTPEWRINLPSKRPLAKVIMHVNQGRGECYLKFRISLPPDF
jgi:hypothetical protein